MSLEKYGFFDANFVNGDYDRKYLAADFARYFSMFISNGVFGGQLDELMVTSSSPNGMKVIVKPGRAWVNGYWYELDLAQDFQLSTADGSYSRVDSVVLRWDKSIRELKIVIVDGVPGSSPVPAELLRNEEFWELRLAEVTVARGVTSITQDNIKDCRADVDLCGFVRALVEEMDIGTYVNSILDDGKASFNNYVNESKNEFDTFINVNEQEFNETLATNKEDFRVWFESVKDLIPEGTVIPIPDIDIESVWNA